jgi:hypothetical protein
MYLTVNNLAATSDGYFRNTSLDILDCERKGYCDRASRPLAIGER